LNTFITCMIKFHDAGFMFAFFRRSRTIKGHIQSPLVFVMLSSTFTQILSGLVLIDPLSPILLEA
jgi:hypothetical protein